MSSTFKKNAIAVKFGRRRFYEFPAHEISENNYDKESDVVNSELVKFISEDIIGKEAIFNGPYGERRIIYCDHIASSRALNSIESYVRKHILPTYGNTHTTTTVTSLQSSMFQQEARTIIRNAVRANEHDAVIFTGSGVTSAVHKLVNALKFQKAPVVFVGPFEHHSNLLPWREMAAHIIPISEGKDGKLNISHLEIALQEWSLTGLEMIGCFSAASNITGVITDTVVVSSLLHKYGALAFWDYATGGPYLDIDMHPPSNRNASKDAIFMSMHKFVGGVDAPGVLVARRSLFRNTVPSGGGGGSVFFVSRSSHRYLQDEESREEGGTPRVVGIVRAALAMELKQSVGTDTIMKLEKAFYEKAMKKWRDHPNIHLLGQSKDHDPVEDRMAVFSFMIFHPETKLYLHHNYVSALLNDVFGIQARGGCACAGPYAQELLGIDEEIALKFEKALLEDRRLDRVHLRRKAEHSSHEVLRPGFVRLNIPYFASLAEASFIIDAVAMVAETGWKCLPQYMFNPETGEWRHTKHKTFADRRWLGQVRFGSGGLRVIQGVKHDGTAPKAYEDMLKSAQDIFHFSFKGSEPTLPDHRLMFSEDVQHLRWFLLPSEAQSDMLGKAVPVSLHKCAISVRKVINELSIEDIKDQIRVPDDVLEMIDDSASQVNRKTNITTREAGIITRDADTKSAGEESAVARTTINDVTIDTALSKSCSNESCCFTKSRSTKVSSDKSSDDVKFASPPKRLFKLTSEAIEEFNMIENNDKVLVCLSGGKDSLSLLHVLHQYQFYSKKKGIDFHLGAVTVDPMTSAYDPSPLIPYLSSLNVPYFYEEQDILQQALNTSATSICAFCSRMKRGRIYACARREGWNVLAFGQHLDDLAESFLMSAFHNGLLRTMKANYVVKEGDLRVIRPFIYVRETDTRSFAESSKLPVIPENCPACFEAPKERHRMKQLLAAQEILHPRLFHSLKEAMAPLVAKHRTGLESRSKSSDKIEDDEL